MFPPIEDLEERLFYYKEKIDRDLEDLEINPNFSDGVESLLRDTNTFSLIALALGMSPEKSEYKEAVPVLIAAAYKLNDVKDLDSAKAGIESLRKAFEQKSDISALQWTKVAHLVPVMKKALPSLSTEIKRLTRSERTFRRGSNPSKIIGDSAAIAAIALGCRPNVDETLAPKEADLWNLYCLQLHKASMDLNRAAHGVKSGSVSFEELSKAFDLLDSTCSSTCHEKFGGTVE
ncbi:MAG: hypothetical protein Q4G69_02020 [Planctomycetia bacterium]|nr:hypothetical protein [Planctomycetia bacterium]